MTTDLSDLTARHERSERARSFVSFALARCFPGDPAAMLADRGLPASHISAFQKTAVPALTSASSLAEARLFSGAFVGLVAPKTVIGRLVGTKRAPMQTNVPVETGAGIVVDWVTESSPYPAGALSFDTAPLPASKLGAIVPFSRELARFADTQNIIEAALVKATARGTDRNFLDPTLAAVALERPASITYGAPQITRSGADPLTIENDLVSLLWSVSNGEAERPYLIMSPGTALFLATLRTTTGDRLFPDVGLLGGRILGVEVLVSAEAGDYITAVDAAALAIADAGVALEPSGIASVQLDSAPSAGATNTISLFQTNSAALRISRFISWARLRGDAVAYLLTDAGSPGSPA